MINFIVLEEQKNTGTDSLASTTQHASPRLLNSSRYRHSHLQFMHKCWKSWKKKKERKPQLWREDAVCPQFLVHKIKMPLKQTVAYTTLPYKNCNRKHRGCHVIVVFTSRMWRHFHLRSANVSRIHLASSSRARDFNGCGGKRHNFINKHF